MKCKCCGNSSFTARQEVSINIHVDGNNRFLNYHQGDAENSVFTAATPHGPYVCTKCGAEYESLIEGSEPTARPGKDWQKKNAKYVKKMDNCREGNEQVQIWDGEDYVVVIVFYPSGYASITVKKKNPYDRFAPDIFIHEDVHTAEPVWTEVKTVSYGPLCDVALNKYLAAVTKAQRAARVIEELFVTPIRLGKFDKDAEYLL